MLKTEKYYSSARHSIRRMESGVGVEDIDAEVEGARSSSACTATITAEIS